MVRLSSLALVASLLTGPSSFVAALAASDIPADTPVSALLASAQDHLSRGQTSDALVYYNAAVARDPSNYLTFFKRATTYLFLGRTSQAVEDYGKVLALRPGFEHAHTALGNIRLRAADWDAAREQFRLASKPESSSEVQELNTAESAAAAAESAESKAEWDACVDEADKAIQIAGRSPQLRERRARCRFASGRVPAGIADLASILEMRPGDTSPHVQISAIQFYALGERLEALDQLRKCLHSDPDSKVCKKLRKQLKAVDAAAKKIESALHASLFVSAAKPLVPSKDGEGLIAEVKAQEAALRDDGTIPAGAGNALVTKLVEMACEAYYKQESSKQETKRKAQQYCQESLQLDENSLYGLLQQARSLVEDEDFEGGIRVLKKAAEAHPDDRDPVQKPLQEAELLLRRSKIKDYYKVLGVARDADSRQIKSAYRKKSKQHHPDKASKLGLSKETAEKKMAEVNEAYEVLSDPELRARFDRGDDPNSQQQQQAPFHGSPFANGHPFMHRQGGGSQHFHFQFGGGGGGFPF